jgi:hypothetical protein
VGGTAARTFAERTRPSLAFACWLWFDAGTSSGTSRPSRVVHAFRAAADEALSDRFRARCSGTIARFLAACGVIACCHM